MPLFWLLYKRVLTEAAGKVGGLLASSFTIESPTACFHISLWVNDCAIEEFNKHCHYHFQAVRWAIPRVREKGTGIYRLFSVQCHIDAISNNLSWDGFDIDRLAPQQEPVNT
jgi:hypothetical protein